MLVAGIIITSIAVMMILFPQFFLLLKNPKISHESLKSTKVKNAFALSKTSGCISPFTFENGKKVNRATTTMQMYTKISWISLFQSTLLVFIAHITLTKHQMILMNTTIEA